MNLLKVLCLVFVIQSCVKYEPPFLGVIPQPDQITVSEGSYTLNNRTVIVSDGTDKGKKLAVDLVDFLKQSFNLDIKLSEVSGGNSIQLLRSKGGENREAYELNSSKDGIKISGTSYQGVFYGIQTLKQLLTPTSHLKKPTVPYLEIIDEPEFAWRGMMLDVSRHFFPIDSVKKVIDILAMHKMNKFHWHLVDGIGWRIRIDKYPELTKKGGWRKVKKDKKPWEDYEACYENAQGEVYGGYYTKDDIREIVAYAAERFIDVIPEIEMPGHSEAALQCYPEFTCEGKGHSGVYCAGNEGTFKFLQDIVSEVIDLFPYDYVHIGGDEVGKDNWLQCEDCRMRMSVEKLHDGEELQSYFVKRMEAFVHNRGRKLIGWDEILEGGLPERATVMSWRGVVGGVEAANAGHDVVMSPGSPCYFDHSQGKSEFEPPSWGGYNNLMKVYDFNPIPKDISQDKRHHILGGQANLWTEQIRTMSHIQYMMLPRLCALSEALWTKPKQKSTDNFIRKIDFHFDRLEELGYNYAGSALSPDYEVKYDKVEKKFNLVLNNELDLYEIRYTLDGTKPSMSSALYTEPILYSSPIDVNAQCFRNGLAFGFPLKKMFSTGFGDQCKVTYTYPYHETYSGGGDKALFDNEFAISRGDDANWQGVKGKDFEIIIDLGSSKKLSYIGTNFFQHIAATSVMLPLSVQIDVSENGDDYTAVLDESINTIEKRDPIIKKIEAKFDKQNVAFIKISAKNRALLPEWHIRNGDAWIFVDEVSVK